MRADSEQHQAHPGVSSFSSPSRRAAAVATLAAILLACPPTGAESPGEIKDRIEAAFGLTPATPPNLTLHFTRRASMHRSLEGGGGTTPLAYSETVAEGLAPLMAVSGSPAAGQLSSRQVENDVELARLPRPRPDNSIITGSIASASSVPERAFFGRFAGSFSGSGQVRRNARENPNQVQCTLTGQPSENRVSITGQCGTSFFSRQIGADIRYDPASGRYSGVYVGASVGPARLSGTRRGDAVVLTITWPKPVNGDTKATMTIRNSGNGQLAITVTDEFQPGGARAEVTRLALNQI